jgi:NAD-dependent deacetylase
MPARWRDERTFDSLPPHCDACGGWLRPGVVWFGEPIDPEALEASGEALDCEVCLAVGTSAVVYPAAGLVTAAGARGAFTAEINPQATPASAAVDLAIAGPARTFWTGSTGGSESLPGALLTGTPARFRV